MVKLSIIIIARNDNYGPPGYINRLLAALKALNLSLRGEFYEIILYDFNPPSDRPLLKEYISDYDNVKYYIFSEEMYKDFINRHYKAGAIISLGDEIVDESSLYSRIPYNYFACFNQALKVTNGEYVLISHVDEILPLGLSKIVKGLKPNVMYRCWRRHILADKLEDELDHIITLRKPSGASRLKNDDLKRNNLFAGAGDFCLMDKNSWLEIGGFFPICIPRWRLIDNHVIYRALSYGKKIFTIGKSDYNIVNVHYIGDNFLKYSGYRYRIKLNNIDFDTTKEVYTDDFEKYKQWAKSKKYNSQVEFIELGYKQRNEEVKEMFKNILTDLYS